MTSFDFLGTKRTVERLHQADALTLAYSLHDEAAGEGQNSPAALSVQQL